MKKRMLVVMVAVLLAVIGSYAVFAQPRPSQPGQPPMGGMGRGMMQGQAGQAGMMCPMCAAMGGAMMQKNIVQTDDGIIVAVGNKLIKYDNDLNKVKETTIDLDISGMQQAMQQMMQNCPMHQQMRQQTAQDQ
jgi:cytochrome c556